MDERIFEAAARAYEYASSEDLPASQHGLRAAVRKALEIQREQTADGAHVYLSTGCLHGDHGYCNAPAGAAGAKKPAQCKFCAARCVCNCHTEGADR